MIVFNQPIYIRLHFISTLNSYQLNLRAKLEDTSSRYLIEGSHDQNNRDIKIAN
jgi:hypothetical protein